MTLAAAVAAATAGCNEPMASPSATADRVVTSPARPAAPTPTPATTAPVAPPADVTVARLNGLSITRSELDDVLYRSYGINLLADVAEFELAKQALAKQGMALTDADVADERQRSLVKMFPADKDTPERFEQDLKQLEANQHFTDVVFDLQMRTGAALRKVARPLIAAQVTDDAVHQAFDLLYGATRRIQDITVRNTVAVSQVQAKLKAGEPFDRVVVEMSTDPRTNTPEIRGQWPPFSAKTPGVPEQIMTEAFRLKPGEVSSDAIVEGDRYHVIKLLEVIPPKLVKYDDVKDEVRRQVQEYQEDQAVSRFRQQLRQATLQGIQVDDPTLRKAWDAMIAAQQPAGKTLSPAEVVPKIHAAEKPPATRP